MCKRVRVLVLATVLLIRVRMPRVMRVGWPAEISFAESKPTRD